MQTSDSCSNEAKKGVSLSATKRLWILEIQYYKNKHSTMFYNRSFLSGSGEQGLVTARPILVSLLYPCVAGFPWSNNRLSLHSSFLGVYSERLVCGCYLCWVFPPLHQKQQNKAICNQIWQGVVMLQEDKMSALKSIFPPDFGCLLLASLKCPFVSTGLVLTHAMFRSVCPT